MKRRRGLGSLLEPLILRFRSGGSQGGRLGDLFVAFKLLSLLRDLRIGKITLHNPQPGFCRFKIRQCLLIIAKRRFGAMLLLDEAHSVGVLGRNGRGVADALGLEGEVDIRMGTLSKALGVAGGYIAGSRRLIELLINRARSFIYSTSPPPAR